MTNCAVKRNLSSQKSKAMRKILIIAIVGVALMSCNVTRTVTTSSEYFQRGDTTVVIQTRTVESYDGTKK